MTQCYLKHFGLQNIKEKCYRDESIFPNSRQDAILPMVVVIPSLRVAKHNDLTPKKYSETMIMELKNVDDKRMQANL